MAWLEQGAMRAEGIEVVAAEKAEWDEAAAAFRLSLNARALPALEVAQVSDDGSGHLATAGNLESNVRGQRVIGAFAGLFRPRFG